jgi:ornithine cyclodeaminase/alanine dehydrogenase-like protein (mu-crystallin family)
LQAECHIQALSTLYQCPIPHVTLINRTTSRAQALAERLLSSTSSPTTTACVDHIDVVALDDGLGVTTAMSTASVVITCTNSMRPLWHSETVLPVQCHVISVGSYTPDMREMPARVVDATQAVWLDTPEARLVGDLQTITPHHPHVTLLGQALLDHESESRQPAIPHWTFPYTMYKSVGTAIQDVMTAQTVVERARQLGLGTEVDMS